MATHEFLVPSRVVSVVVRRDERGELRVSSFPSHSLVYAAASDYRARLTFAPCSLAAAVILGASKGSTTAPALDASSMTRYIQLSERAWTGMTCV